MFYSSQKPNFWSYFYISHCSLTALQGMTSAIALTDSVCSLVKDQNQTVLCVITMPLSPQLLGLYGHWGSVQKTIRIFLSSQVPKVMVEYKMVILHNWLHFENWNLIMYLYFELHTHWWRKNNLREARVSTGSAKLHLPEPDGICKNKRNPMCLHSLFICKTNLSCAFWKLNICFLQNSGVAATKSQCCEAGDVCPICKAAFREPQALPCQVKPVPGGERGSKHGQWVESKKIYKLKLLTGSHMECEMCTPSFLLKHIFCDECIALWLNRERTCPLCRTVIADKVHKWQDGATSPHLQVYWETKWGVNMIRRQTSCQTSWLALQLCWLLNITSTAVVLG